MANTNDFLSGVLNDRGMEPQRSNSALLYLLCDKLGLGVQNATETLKLSLASFPLPKNESEVTSIPYLNETRKYAGRTVFMDMTVSFHDYVSRDIASVLWGWRYKVYDPRTGIKGTKLQYACDGYIEVFGPNNSSPITYTLQGIWPHSADFGDIEMGSDEPLRISVNFAVDKCFIADDGGLTLPGPNKGAT